MLAKTMLLSGEMCMLFRRNLEDMNSEWHFRPDCLWWPKVNYQEIDTLNDEDHICKECIKLQTTFSAPSSFIFKLASFSILNPVPEFSWVSEVMDPTSIALSVLGFVLWQTYRRSFKDVRDIQRRYFS